MRRALFRENRTGHSDVEGLGRPKFENIANSVILVMEMSLIKKYILVT